MSSEKNWWETSEEDVRRLLGLRDFEALTPEQKQDIFVSGERLAAFEGITTNTMPIDKKTSMKKGIAAEVAKREIIPELVLKEFPVVYIGSGTDVEYPLVLGGRHIVMIDPIFKDERARQEVIEKIVKLIKENPVTSPEVITFQFDFGKGKENVEIKLIPESYSIEDGKEVGLLPDKVGVLILFASQGPKGSVRIDDNMKGKVVNGGCILKEANVLAKDKETGVETEFELGK